MVEPFQSQAVNRLKRARGQIDGLIKLIEGGEYCVDILTQTLALQGALKGVASVVLESHLNTCGEKLASKKSEEKQKFIKELVKTFEISRR